MTIPEALKSCLKQAWKPVVADGDGLPTVSKFSGKPLLLRGEDWPRCPSCDQPMQFFMQLHLDALPESLRVEFGSGWLQMFYCTNWETECEIQCEAWGPFAKSHFLRVIAGGDVTEEVEIPNPAGMFPAKQIIAWEEMSDFPNGEECSMLGVTLSDEESDHLADAGYPHSGDKLGGWPCWVQGVEYPNCPVCNEPMRLVFQIDSENNLPYMFGDMGCGHITQCKTHKDRVAFGWACG